MTGQKTDKGISLSDLVPDDPAEGREALVELEEHHRPPDSLDIDPGEILQEMSKLHHIAAWLFANGVTVLKVSVATGIDTLRLKQMLLYSTNFNTQVEYYKQHEDDIPNYDPKESANVILSEALEVLRRRLANNPEDFSNTDLTRLIEMLSSRTDLGLNPKAPEQSNVVTTEAIAEIRKTNSPQTASAIPLLEEMLATRTGQQRMADGSEVPQQVSEIQRGK